MPITTNNTDYYDDYSVPDATNGLTPDDKNYLRILFKPGYSVQVRELNQMQSMLQAQIDKFGGSVWKDGAAVIGGNVTFDNNVSAVDVSAGEGSTLTNELLSTITAVETAIAGAEGNSSLTADVIGYKEKTDGVYTLYIRYKNSVILAADGSNVETFSDGAVLDATSTTTLSVNLDVIGSPKFAAGIFLDKGLFFTKGCFVATPVQSVFIDKTSGADEKINGSGRLFIEEKEVSANDDSTLYDNANDTLNFKAPGADRYGIDLTLDFLTKEQEEFNSSDSIALITIVDNRVVEVVRDRYTSLDRELAKRTFEESGNYTLKPFKLELKECFKDTSETYRLGRYTSSDLDTLNIEDEDAKDKYYIGVDPSVAYVDGFRVEPPSKSELLAEKARTSGTFVNSNIYAAIGNYVIGTFDSGSKLPAITNFAETYNIGTSEGDIGTAKIRAVESNGPTDYRIYLYDIDLDGSSNISQITYISSDDVNITVTVPITNTNSNTNIFKLPYDAIESVQNITYNSLLYFTGTTAVSTGNISIDLGANQTLIDTSSSSFIIEVDGTIYVAGSIVGGPTGVITIEPPALGGWDPELSYTLIVQTQSNTSHITKTVTSVANEAKTAVTNSVNGVFTLDNAQLFDNTYTVKYGATDGADVSSDFILFDDGQRDNFVTNVKLKYVGPKVLTTSDVFYFTYKYFANNVSSGFSTVDSYVLTGDNASAGLTYSNIPLYKGIRLSDAIDFRPVILEGVSGSILSITLNPNSLIASQSKYYLPKIDKVVVSSNNKISVVSGIPSLNPIEPETPLNSMPLYVLEVPAYTYNVSDIVINYINNRRYTMRDIGALDNRISNIEYYTTLSLLERSANERPISDVVETRFKNGIIVDSFRDFTSADINNPAYKASIDINAGVLRPAYNTTRIDLKPDETSSSTTGTINANSASLPYTEESYIEQKFASESESVNPYDVAIFVGTLDLSPSSDEWQDTNRIVTNVFDPNTTNVALSNTLQLGDIWDNWVVTESYTYRKRKKWWKKKKTYTVIVEKQRTGVNRTLELEDVENETINDINLTIIPFIRSRKIYFSANNLKPNTRLYPFFDGFDVSEYVYTVTDAEFVNFKDSTDVTIYTGKTPAEADITQSTCITNNAGEVKGVLLIPNNSNLKFKTGVRQFKLTDHPTNNVNSETTYAAADYIAYGTTKTVNSTLTTTRTPKLIENNIKQILRNGVTVTYRDPIAQSFLIDNIRSSAGVFLSSVDLYFERKSETLPVSICIVTMENGTPTQNIVPFSQVTLNPYALNEDGTYNINEPIIETSDNASVATKFTFSDLVYLNAGNEYALVVRSNDSEYRAFVSRVGGKNIGSTNSGQLINKNPYSGVLFMSANSSTWTPDQNRDLKFTLHRAKFEGSSAGVRFVPNLSTGVQSITVTVPGSGYTSTPDVLIDSPPSGGITATAVAVRNPITQSITSINVTNPGSGYTSTPNVLIGSVDSGGGSAAAATAVMLNIPISTFNLTQNGIEPYATEDTVNSESATGIVNTLTFDVSNGFANVLPDENYDFKSTYSITLANANAVNLQSTLLSYNDYVSPFIDLDNVSLLAVDNIIGTPQSLYDGADDTEVLSDAGNGLSRYITRTVELNQPADRLTVFVDLNRPSAGSYIKMYVKLKHDDTTNTWYEMIPKNGTVEVPQNGIPISSDISNYSEVEYTYKSTDNDFTAFAVKIVFVSDVTYTPTTVQNFRAIATSGIE